MGKKEVKTNAVRILERNKIEYELINYECDEFIDGMHTIEKPELLPNRHTKRSLCREKANNTMSLSFRLLKK